MPEFVEHSDEVQRVTSAVPATQRFRTAPGAKQRFVSKRTATPEFVSRLGFDVAVVSGTGPAGPPGPQGPMGPPGKPEFSGIGPPPDVIPGAQPGMSYVDLVSGDVYLMGG